MGHRAGWPGHHQRPFAVAFAGKGIGDDYLPAFETEILVLIGQRLFTDKDNIGGFPRQRGLQVRQGPNGGLGRGFRLRRLDVLDADDGVEGIGAFLAAEGGGAV